MQHWAIARFVSRLLSAFPLRRIGMVSFLVSVLAGWLVFHGAAYPQELVLIDAAVSHPTFFVSQLRPDQAALLLTSDSSIDSITQRISRYRNLKAIHVISHGKSGQVQLGRTPLNVGQLAGTPNHGHLRSQLRLWGEALAKDGDLFLYGCDVAGGPSGLALMQTLRQITGADIAASVDLTGDVDLGGNWHLEAALGSIGSSLTLQGHYGSTLRQLRVDDARDRGMGTLRWAIAQANHTPEDDLITLLTGKTPIVLESPLPVIQSNLYLDGRGAIVSGGEQFRVFEMRDSNVVVHDLTIADGLAQGDHGRGLAGGSAGLGGGLLIDNSGVTLSRVLLVNNRAIGGNGGDRPAPSMVPVATVIETEKQSSKVNRGAITHLNGIGLPPEGDDAQNLPLKISGTHEKFSANRGAIAGVNGIGVGGIGSIAFGGGGGFGGFGNAGNGGNGGNGGADGGSGGNGGDGGDGGVGIFGSLGRWQEDGSIGTLAFGGGGGFGGFGNAGNGGNGGNPDGAIANGGSGGNGGNGGFGGGGGGGGNGGNGGFGGRAGQPGTPGQGGEGGGNGEVGYGGGGAGLGGAIFLKTGRLILHRTTFDQNAAIAGVGAHPGTGAGAAIFNLPGQDPHSAGVQIFSLGGFPQLQPSADPDATTDVNNAVDIVGGLTVLGNHPSTIP